MEPQLAFDEVAVFRGADNCFNVQTTIIKRTRVDVSGIVCLIAHPDDEHFCAGTLVELARRGITVRLVCFTRGEGGRHLGDPPCATSETIGQVREAEMRCAARKLQVTSLDFLDHRDRPRSDSGHQPPLVDVSTLSTELTAIISRYQPEAVLTHGSSGEYGHPAHCLLHMAAMQAVRQSQPQPALYSFMAYHPSLQRKRFLQNEGDWADLIVNVTDTEDLRYRALCCHRTQWTLFAGRQQNPSSYRKAILQRIRRYPEESFHLHTAGAAGRVLQSWLTDRERMQQLNIFDRCQDKMRRLSHEQRWRGRRAIRRALGAVGLLRVVRGVRDEISRLIRAT